MQHDDGQSLGILRDLVEGVEMVAVEGLTHRGRVVVVVGPRRRQNGAADSNASLLLNRERHKLSALIGHRGHRRKHCDHGHQRRYEPIA